LNFSRSGIFEGLLQQAECAQRSQFGNKHVRTIVK
jgi:hypothetical protein